jgi:hypothetical protein
VSVFSYVRTSLSAVERGISCDAKKLDHAPPDRVATVRTSARTAFAKDWHGWLIHHDLLKSRAAATT